MGKEAMWKPLHTLLCSLCKIVFVQIRQPTTASQLAHHVQQSIDGCSYILQLLTRYGLLYQLNPLMRRHRLYWLTYLGKQYQAWLRTHERLPPLSHDFPKVNWKRYAEVCFPHRAVVIKVLTRPMQPSHIKRAALHTYQDVRISANNVRDVIYFLRSVNVVTPVRLPRQTYTHYELTPEGRHFRRLLIQAEVRG